jgi:hypothetical protein
MTFFKAPQSSVVDRSEESSQWKMQGQSSSAFTFLATSRSSHATVASAYWQSPQGSIHNEGEGEGEGAGWMQGEDMQHLVCCDLGGEVGAHHGGHCSQGQLALYQ